MRLQKLVSAGERWSFFSAGVVNICQLVILVLLARLIPPAAFASLAIANTFLGFGQLLLQTGLSHSLFSQAGSQIQMSTLFWVHILLAIIINIALGALAMPLEHFFTIPSLSEVIWCLGISLLFGAVAAYYRVLHLKDLQFGFLARTEMASVLAGSIFALFMAWNGWGVFALAFQVVVRAVFECLLLMVNGSRLFKPSLSFKISSVRPHLHFAASHIGERITMWLTSQLDVLLIGKLLGAEILGVYEVFRRLLNRPPAVLGEMMERMSLPLMARYRGRPQLLKRIYLSNLQLMIAVVFPAYGFITFSSGNLVPLLFGKSWDAYTMVFSTMALTVAFNSVGHPLDNLLVARGTINRLLYWNIAYFPLYISIILFGARWGLLGIALILMLAAVLISNFGYFFLMRFEISVKPGEYIKPLFKTTLLVLLSGLLPVFLIFWQSGWWILLSAGVAYTITYLGLIRWYQPGIWYWLIKFADLREAE